MNKADTTESPFEEFDKIEKLRRRQILPWWIKIGCWIYMLWGVFSILSLLPALFGVYHYYSIFGLETENPLRLYGFLILIKNIFSGYTGYALWFEKDYAIKLGKIFAILGLIFGIGSMIYFHFMLQVSVSFRLDILLLLAFLVKLIHMEDSWKQSA